MMSKENYDAPQVEVVTIVVERGFAATGWPDDPTDDSADGFGDTDVSYN